MSNIEELQAIRDQLKDEHNWSTDEAVEHIASELKRSKSTVYNWLSGVKIPEHIIELLRFKFNRTD